MMLYIGKGAFIPDVPARDLTHAEVLFYGVERLLASGLYVPAVKVVKDDAPKKSKYLETVTTDGGN